MSILSEKKVTVFQSQEIIAPEVILEVSPQIPQSLNVTKALYSHAAVGGALGTYYLELSKPIPQGSAVGNFFINAIVPVTGAVINISLGLNTAVDIRNMSNAYSTSMTFANVLATNDIYQVIFTINAPITGGVLEFLFAYA
jgi:hypothetical protein